MAHIVIAEDEEVLRTFLLRALADHGHFVKGAADGADALDLITGVHGKVDLLIADIQMPVMDGIALALAVARDYPQVVILLMTGYAEQRERAQGLQALVHDVLAKPFGIAELRAAVAAALAARGERGTA
jgi:CheY-like chemotaxis protein